jgi:hypothetical protein
MNYQVRTEQMTAHQIEYTDNYVYVNGSRIYHARNKYLQDRDVIELVESLGFTVPPATKVSKPFAHTKEGE